MAISNYELAESMLRTFKEELDYIKIGTDYVNKVSRIAQASEYLAKALIHAMGWNIEVKGHEVSKLLIDVCRESPIPLTVLST